MYPTPSLTIFNTEGGLFFGAKTLSLIEPCTPQRFGKQFESAKKNFRVIKNQMALPVTICHGNKSVLIINEAADNPHHINIMFEKVRVSAYAKQLMKTN